MGNLLTSAYVARRLQIDTSLDGVMDTLDDAIGGAQLHVEEQLDSKLSLQDWDVVYFLNSDFFSGLQPNGFMTLQLPSGFVRHDVDHPITILTGNTWLTTIDGVDNTLIKWDYDRGLLRMDALTYKNKYVHVTCSTGFIGPQVGVQQGDGSLSAATVAEVIPDWLRDVVLAFVPRLLSYGRVIEKPQIIRAGVSRDPALSQAEAIISNYLRNPGFCYRPIA